MKHLASLKLDMVREHVRSKQFASSQESIPEIITSVKRMLEASFSIGHVTLGLEYASGGCTGNTCFGPLCLASVELGKGTAE